MECVDLCIQLSIRQSVARCPPERSGGWAPTISPGAQPILPLTSLQFYVATDFTSEWSRTWSQPADSRGCLEFYSGTVMPPPPGHHHQSKEGHIIISTGSEVAQSSTVGTLILHPPYATTNFKPWLQLQKVTQFYYYFLAEINNRLHLFACDCTTRRCAAS